MCICVPLLVSLWFWDTLLFVDGEIMTRTERTGIDVVLDLVPGPDLIISHALTLVQGQDHAHVLRGINPKFLTNLTPSITEIGFKVDANAFCICCY